MTFTDQNPLQRVRRGRRFVGVCLAVLGVFAVMAVASPAVASTPAFGDSTDIVEQADNCDHECPGEQDDGCEDGCHHCGCCSPVPSTLSGAILVDSISAPSRRNHWQHFLELPSGVVTGVFRPPQNPSA